MGAIGKRWVRDGQFMLLMEGDNVVWREYAWTDLQVALVFIAMLRTQFSRSWVRAYE